MADPEPVWGAQSSEKSGCSLTLPSTGTGLRRGLPRGSRALTKKKGMWEIFPEDQHCRGERPNSSATGKILGDGVQPVIWLRSITQALLKQPRVWGFPWPVTLSGMKFFLKCPPNLPWLSPGPVTLTWLLLLSGSDRKG